jgi:hypothetical protein
MHRVIVDCFRVGHDRRRPYRNAYVHLLRREGVPIEQGEDEAGAWMDLSQRVSGAGGRGMRPRKEGRCYGRKYAGDRLAPLIRYLRAQVGRPWDDVWSEMRRTVPGRGTMNLHLYEHVAMQILLAPLFYEDGTPADNERGLSPFTCHPLWFRGWVCPRTGILKAAARG